MVRLVAAALTALLPAVVQAADLDGRARLSLGTGIDTNARRDATQVGAVPDVMFSLVGSAEGRVTWDRAQLLGSYDGGVRKFVFFPSEDVLVQSANGEGSVALGKVIGVGLLGRARDRRGGRRDYTDLSGSAFIDFVPDVTLDLRVYGGGHRFIYWPDFKYSFAATELGGSARYRFDKRHSVLVFGEVGTRQYNSLAERPPAPEDEEPAPEPTSRPSRADTVFSVGAGYSYRGAIPVSATYSYVDQTSNSYGETTRRHRLSATAAFRLPWRLYLFAQAALQFSMYPQGFRLSPELVLDEDAENHNSLSLRLVRPITSSLDLELRAAAYRNRLPNFDYDRQLVWFGITWRR